MNHEMYNNKLHEFNSIHENNVFSKKKKNIF
jgi:hypothetical protein